MAVPREVVLSSQGQNEKKKKTMPSLPPGYVHSLSVSVEDHMRRTSRTYAPP